MQRKALYAMISQNGDGYTIFFHALEQLGRTLAQGSDPNIFSAYLYDGIPVIDLRTAHDLTGLDRGAREERSEAAPDLPSLQELLLTAKQGGARVYPLRPESFAQLLHDAINERHLRYAMAEDPAGKSGSGRLDIPERFFRVSPAVGMAHDAPTDKRLAALEQAIGTAGPASPDGP